MYHAGIYIGTLNPPMHMTPYSSVRHDSQVQHGLPFVAATQLTAQAGWATAQLLEEP
mgnify:CR=1 FL=1